MIRFILCNCPQPISILAVWALVVALTTLGCANFGPGMQGFPCPVAWNPSESIDPEAATLRARMRIQIDQRDVHLEIVSRSQRGELVIVGLARFGVRLFAVRQRGVEVEIESAQSEELSQIAIWAMDALHRAYWLDTSSEATATDTLPLTSHRGERVLETTTGDTRRREFVWSTDTEMSSDPNGMTPRVTIDYARPTVDSNGRFGVASVRNPWCGYEAQIAPIWSATTQSR